jgi:hypothetical protein
MIKGGLLVMSHSLQQDRPSMSAGLAQMLLAMPADGLTLRGLLEQLGERGLLILCMVLTLPFLLPVSIPGTSLPFGMIIALNGVGIFTHTAPWLPARVMNCRFAADDLRPVFTRGIRLFLGLERWVHPRLWPLTHGPTMGRFNGLLLMLSGLLLMVPLPLPFANALPAYGALFLAVGSLERDGAFVPAGYAMVLLTIVYFALVAVVGGIGAQTVMSLW